MHVTRAPFWHGGLRKDKWECLMNTGFYGLPGIADHFINLLLRDYSKDTGSFSSCPRLM
jgi:hypothetical protein